MKKRTKDKRHPLIPTPLCVPMCGPLGRRLTAQETSFSFIRLGYKVLQYNGREKMT